MRRAALALVLLTLAACTHAQPAADSGASVASEDSLHPALAPLAGLLGTWEGPATAMTQAGPQELWQTEEVRTELGGRLVVVEGTGRERGEDGALGEVVFNAFGIFSVDAQTGTVYFDAFTMEGRHTRVAPAFVEGGFDWGMDVENGPLVRYQMRFDEAGRWVETGRVSMDTGGTWMDFFEMTLDRVEPDAEPDAE